MSWTVPVPAYQYMDYQTRVAQPQRNRYTIERTYPVKLIQEQESFQKHVEERIDHQAYLQSLPSQNSLHVSQQPVVTNTEYPELTGKGRYINTVR